VCVFDVQVNLEQWILVVTNRDQPLAVEFSSMYVQCAAAMGIRVAQPAMVTINNDRTETYLQAVRSRLSPQVQAQPLLSNINGGYDNVGYVMSHVKDGILTCGLQSQFVSLFLTTFEGNIGFSLLTTIVIKC